MTLKNNLVPLENSLDVIKKLNIYSYTWNENIPKLEGQQGIGVIAQELEKIYNYAVIKNENEDFLKVDYSRLVPFLIKAIQELLEIVERK